ncbi:MAG: hypothetical protein ACLFTP_12860 [Rhodosalinus sp.]
MSDRLTPEERAAIAAYEGPVTRVPRGASALDHGLSWRDSDASGSAWRRMLRRRRFEAAELQARIVSLYRAGATLAEIARAVGLKPSTVDARLARAGINVPVSSKVDDAAPAPAPEPQPDAAPDPGPAPQPEPEPQLGPQSQPEPEPEPAPQPRLDPQPEPEPEIAARPSRHSSHDRAVVKKAARAEKKRARLRDRRRFKLGNVAGGAYANLAPEGATGTIFPFRVSDVGPDDRVLKDGAMSAKIGGDVLVGHLKGARILTLTLEERATCPTSCAHWRGCYGNNMPHATRWRPGDALEERLCVEVAELCAAHERVLIRLHVLGDFYSGAYVALWLGLLALYPNLYAFGFTAWGEDTALGRAIVAVRTAFPDRFMIRHSGRTGVWGSFDITDPFPEKTIGDAIVCPEQRESNLGDSARHCGSCGVCWSTDRPVAFIRH